MGRLVVWLVGWALKKNLTFEQRNKITVHILSSLQALPLHEIISVNDEGAILVNDRPLDMEKAIQLREAAVTALNNQALSLIREQVMYEALIHGGLKAGNVEGLMFTRSAVWWGQQEEKLLKLLAQREEPDL